METCHFLTQRLLLPCPAFDWSVAPTGFNCRIRLQYFDHFINANVSSIAPFFALTKQKFTRQELHQRRKTSLEFRVHHAFMGG
jgi:hypothetical protein